MGLLVSIIQTAWRSFGLLATSVSSVWESSGEPLVIQIVKGHLDTGPSSYGLAEQVMQIIRLLIISCYWFYVFPIRGTTLHCLALLVSLENCGHKYLCALPPTLCKSNKCSYFGVLFPVPSCLPFWYSVTLHERLICMSHSWLSILSTLNSYECAWTAVHCRKATFWPRLRAAVACEYRYKYLEDSLTMCPFSMSIIVGSPPRDFVVLSHVLWLGLQSQGWIPTCGKLITHYVGHTIISLVGMSCWYCSTQRPLLVYWWILTALQLPLSTL